ncbi:hypothetical protein [Leptolyngbya sp. 7M]|uniref:hypothetical protein n=1 Tax=Leptolyngbya sp. 7M TaxID=2812896 RepID=UPI001B8C1C64|nr:hypothetical protein [Leptolyngbya sp. 7M]QYO66167.1 hypothetical protein JVX88_05030 [Leptolyngbya sp. 7M]
MRYRKKPTEQMFVRSHGVTMRVRSNSQEAFGLATPLIEASLPGCEITMAARPFDHDFVYIWNKVPFDAVYKNGEKIDARRSRETAPILLAAQLRLCVAEHSPDFTFVHAGVVAVNGKAILLPAKSFHGKTTLTAELVRRGAKYYSDEFAVIDKRGRIHPFPKDLSMRGIIDDLQQVEIPVEEIGGKAGKRPVTAGLIIFTEYVENEKWAPKKLTPGQALLELVNHTIPIRANAASAIKTLSLVVQNAICISSKRGNASETVDRILEIRQTV